MKIYLKIQVLLFLCVACKSENSVDKIPQQNPIEGITSIPPDFLQTQNEIAYKIHQQNNGTKAKLGDYLVLDLRYKTESNYQIFEKKDLSFEFNQQLFSGALNEALKMMAKGDSATFIIPAHKIYQKKLPTFVKQGEGIIFDVKIHDILNENEYKQKKRSKSLTK